MHSRDRKRLEEKYRKLVSAEKTFLGYPCDAEFDYSPIYKFLKFPLNNVGDPWEHGTFRLETKEFECEVLGFFAKLYRLKDYWGYITNGGTEGNLYGLYVAREHMPKAKVYFSEHTHYSIKKNVHLLGLNHCIIKSQQNGEMDYADFEKKLSGREAIMVANIGTTMTGAIDDVNKIASILEKKKIKYYIHADAALYGMVLPFVKNAKQFDFRTRINSIAVSGHKFIGSPVPCGIVLVRKKSMGELSKYISYINAHDDTISGSRDAFTALVLWYRLKTIGLAGFRKQIAYSLGLAGFLVNELKKIGWPGVAQSYITVRFKRPSEKLVFKWSLAANNNIAHVICLPHESKTQLEKFVQDLKKELGS